MNKYLTPSRNLNNSLAFNPEPLRSMPGVIVDHPLAYQLDNMPLEINGPGEGIHKQKFFA